MLWFKRKGSISHTRLCNITQPHKTVTMKYCTAWFCYCFFYFCSNGHTTSEDEFATSRLVPIETMETILGTGAPKDVGTAIQPDNKSIFELIIFILLHSEYTPPTHRWKYSSIPRKNPNDELKPSAINHWMNSFHEIFTYPTVKTFASDY